MFTEIIIKSAKNGIIVTVDTLASSYDYVYKDLNTATRKIKHLLVEIENEESTQVAQND